MQNFDDILRAELEKRLPVRGKEGQTIEPMEAMVRSLMKKAVDGDIASIAFIRNMTRTSDPVAEAAAQARHTERVATVAGTLTEQLKNEGAWDGQSTELEQLAETVVLIEQINEMMAAPDFQLVTTDARTGHQAVSPLIALRDKQRDMFQQQLNKLRQEAINRIIARRHLQK